MSDEELMHALAQGDLDKAALLFERWHLRLFNFLHRLGQDPALERLPPDDRELLVMSRFEELKYEEIAEATGLSLANVKVRIHRAIKKLREVYFQLEA
jgi:DNA-binding NarL/FixJ family response regulator